jgi:guanylate cyclase soluble subunit beta
MIGWINLSIEHFITESFGLDKWKEVVEKSEIDPNWISSCPYSDKITYE